ncbi:MATE family efflux transporter [Proteocatella sphenisci]|uniref:MATE family efflux transporter n=1 Tax=Proteocatella sphenisci TaxID=181070 RepID=UPI0004918D66|nr:MATE family efflux transporter [Proteocatella sphenisci]
MTIKDQRAKELYKTMFTVAIPIVIQNLIGNALTIVDTVMVSSLGEASVAAVGIAGRLQFLFVLITFGFYSGAGIFMAQYYGSRSFDKMRTTMAIQLILGIMSSAVFMTVALVFPRWYMGIFSNDSLVIELGIKYLRYLGWGFGMHAISYAYIVSMRSIRDSLYPMYVSIVALLVNTFLNYGLIFGNFGMPQLGVEGAAIATTTSRFIEAGFMIYSVYFGSRFVLKAKIADFKNIELAFLKRYFKIALPVIFNEGLWGLGTVMLSVAYAKLGTQAVAVSQIASTINDLMMVLAFGIASSSSTILGNKLGEGSMDVAIFYSRRIMVIAFMLGIITSGAILLFIPLVPLVFKLEPESIEGIKRILIVKAIFSPFITFNWTNVIGILRSGGDTIAGLMLEIIPLWLIAVPISFAGALYFGWPIEIVILAGSMEEIIKMLFGVPRVLKNKWVKNIAL